MPACFFDTSALIKAYIPEHGSSWVIGVMRAKAPTPRMFISELSRVEVPSALYKLERLRGYAQAFTDTAMNIFARDLRLSAPPRQLRVFDIITLTDAALVRAGTLLEKYRTGKPFALRSLDAIQLACATFARDGLPSSEQTGMVFATVDRQLRGVAAAEGFVVINPEYPGTP